jgi:hypothetical protein
MRQPEPELEQTVTDGQRHVGTIIPKSGGFEVYDADRKYLCKGETRAEARKVLLDHDRQTRA